MKTNQETVIKVQDWDKLITTTYGRVYSFQQQDGCKDRSREYITVPVEFPEDYENDSIPEEVNHEKMGVSFKAWLKRDPQKLLANPKEKEQWYSVLWWERNFYPHIDMLINDLYTKGLIKEGKYTIDINW